MASRILHGTQLFEGIPKYHLKKIPIKFGKNPVNSFWGEVFLKERFTDARTHGRTDAWTHDRHNAITIDRWPSASGANNQDLFGKEFRYFYVIDLNKRAVWTKDHTGRSVQSELDTCCPQRPCFRQ